MDYGKRLAAGSRPLPAHAEKLYVGITPQPGVVEQIPAGVGVVVVNVDVVPIPAPVTAIVDVVRSHNPRGAVHQHHAAGANVNRDGAERPAHVLIPAVRECAPGDDPFVVVIPVTMVVPIVLIPALVFSVVVAVISVAAVTSVATVVAVPLRHCQSGCYG